MTTTQLQESVLEELEFDPLLTSQDIHVTVEGATARLSGTVPNFNERWEAENAAKRVQGIEGVVDEIIVDLPGTHVSSDADIARSIQHRFVLNPMVPRTVQFHVRNAFVTLTGEVDWPFEAEEAAADARTVRGVRGISNNIVSLRRPRD
jgi:osmotically-inducible protein OsmY